MNADKDKLCIKPVALDAIYNFLYKKFFHLKLL
jgi:hypothetical protein